MLAGKASVFTRKDDDTSPYSCFDSLSQYLIYEFQKSFRPTYWQMVEALLRYREPETTDFNVYPEGWVNETDIEDLKYYLLSGAYNFEGKAYLNLHFSDELAEFLVEKIDAFVQGEQTLSEWLESEAAERFGESSEEYKALRIWLRARKPSFYVAPSKEAGRICLCRNLWSFWSRETENIIRCWRRQSKPDWVIL